MSLDIRRAIPGDAPRLAQLARDTFIAAFGEDNTAENMALYVDAAFSDATIASELTDPASTFCIGLAGSPTKVARVFSPEPRGNRWMFSGTAAEQVTQLVAEIRGYL